MLYLYVELRFHRQLHRICPDVPVRLFSSLDDSVRKNGGQVSRVGQAMLYTFDHASAGFAFSASRVIEDLRILLADMRERIREYFVLVDSTPDRLNPDAFRERLREYDAVIIPDETILLTPESLSLLSSYIASVPLNGTSLVQYTGTSINENAVAAPESVRETQPLVIYTDYHADPVKLLRDMLAAGGAIDTSLLELSTGNGERFAVDAYSWYRFSPEQDDYRKEAVLTHYSQLLLALSKRYSGPVPVTVRGTTPPDNSISFLREMLSGLCRFSEPEKQEYKRNDPASIPEDLCDMAYLVYHARKYLYYDELPSFFQFLGKDTAFMNSLGSWLYSYGVLSDPADFRSLNPALEKITAEQCGARLPENDRRIAEFLWTQLQSGFLMPSIELEAVFSGLGFPVDDSFRAACCLYSDKPADMEQLCGSYNSLRVRDAVRQLFDGEAAFSRREYGKAETAAREVLHSFQKEGIACGEYHAFILLSRLSLVKNKGDDAVVYLEYARECAVRTHHQFSVLAASRELSCVHFGVGSLDASLSVVEYAEKRARNCFAKDHESFLVFIKGRIHFEIGDYRSASSFFQDAASIATMYRFPDIAAMARVWFGRTLSHEGRYHAADQIFEEYADSVPESPVFLLESALLSGHPRSAETLAELAKAMEEHGTGKGGFTLIEDRLNMGNDRECTAYTLFRVFHAFHRARFDVPDCVSDRLEFIDATARDAFTRNDPYANLYYYICFELARFIPASDRSDGTGYLSRAFKYLQKRAKEIGDTMMREQFLAKPVWNNRLYRAAKEHMLI